MTGACDPTLVLRQKTTAPPRAAAVFAPPKCTAASDATIRNVFTVDLEDWPIAVLGPEHEISGRVVDNTKQVLRLLRWHGVRATFFVLTKVAQRYPDLIRMVRDDGHELASHGHGHELVTRLTPDRFEDDVARSIDILTMLTGERPMGYRAPAFSIVAETRWAGEALQRLGFTYDSSVFPIRHPRYGIADAPREFHRWPGLNLIEAPPATLRVGGRSWPIAGGGYFRLLPGSFVRTGIWQRNRQRQPAVLYMHPYELDVDGIGIHRWDGVRFSRWRGLTQGMFRKRMEQRLHRLLESFRFETMAEAVSRWESATSCTSIAYTSLRQ